MGTYICSKAAPFCQRMASVSFSVKPQVLKNARISEGLAQGISEPNRILSALWADTSAFPMAAVIPVRSLHMAVSK